MSIDEIVEKACKEAQIYKRHKLVSMCLALLVSCRQPIKMGGANSWPFLHVKG